MGKEQDEDGLIELMTRKAATDDLQLTPEEDAAMLKLRELILSWPETLSLKLLPDKIQVFKRTAPFLSQMISSTDRNPLFGKD